MFRSDRNRCGGGVAVYCADHLPYSTLSCGASASGVEFLWVSIKSGCFHPSLVLGCLYCLPSSPAQSVHDVCDNIESVMVSMKHVLACGDFNIDMANLDKPYSKTLQSFITTHSLTQPISHLTRYSGASNSILDLFLVSPDVPISKSVVLESSSDIYPSFFNLIVLCPNLPLP